MQLATRVLFLAPRPTSNRPYAPPHSFPKLITRLPCNRSHFTRAPTHPPSPSSPSPAPLRRRRSVALASSLARDHVVYAPSPETDQTPTVSGGASGP
jgi:hypothetical protein